MKKRLKYLILMLLISLTCGCMKYQDLNDLAIIKSIGLKKDKEYLLYAEIIEEIDKDNKPQMQVYEAKGQEIKDLFTNIKLQVNKEIYLSHIDLLLLDTNLQNSDYEKMISYFLHNNEIRNDFYCVLTNDIKDVLEKEKYDEIEELIKTNKDNQKVINLTMEELIQNFLDQKSFIISKITLHNNQIVLDGNYLFQDNQLERINNDEKSKN